MADIGVSMLTTPVDVSTRFATGVETEADLTGDGLAADATWAIIRYLQPHSTDKNLYFWKPGGSKPSLDRQVEEDVMGFLFAPVVSGKVGCYRQDGSHRVVLYGSGYGGTWKNSPDDIEPTWHNRALWYPKEVDTEAPSAVAIAIDLSVATAAVSYRPNGSAFTEIGECRHYYGFSALAGGSYNKLKENYDGHNTTVYINSATRQLAMLFKANENFTVSQLWFKFGKDLSPGNVTVELQGVSGGKPDNSAIASGTIQESDIPTLPSTTWLKIDINQALISGTQYAIVIKAPGCDGTNRVHIEQDTTSPTYTDGYICWTNDGGTNWNITANDARFEVWAAYTPGHSQIFDIYRNVPTTIDHFLTGYFVSGEIHIPSDLQEVSLSGTGWLTGDVSSWITGDKMGVFVIISDTAAYSWGIRKTGSSDTQKGTGQQWYLGMVELDWKDQFQFYRDNAGVRLYFVASFAAKEPLFEDDRIYVFLGDSSNKYKKELTDPTNPFVLAAHSERGWDEELAQATAGIIELTCDNRNGDFSPEKAGGAFYGDLYLGARITFFEVYLGVRYNHFTGRIEKILPHAEHDNQVAYIMVLDGTDDIAATTVSTILRTNTHTGELAEDVLDACKWPAADREIDTGVDTLDAGWFHKRGGLEAFRDLELTEKGRFFIKPTGKARFENRHYRITGGGLVSQGTFDETMVELGYEYSKRLLYNEIIVTGARYFAGGIQLFSGYDLGTIDDDLIWSAHTGDAAAPYIPQNTTVVIWAEFNALLSSYDALVKGTHWNANTAADKSGADVSDNITITETQYGQAVKLSIANAGSMGAYLVVPDSPPAGAPSDRTLLIYGVLFSVENITFVEENTTSQDNYGKRTLPVKAPFKSKPNDLLAYAQWLLARFEEPIPTPIFVKHVARTAWPDDTIRIQCLTREISDRITLASSKLGFNRDFYINKVIQDYVFLQGGAVHETIWIVERAEGSAEGLYWLLGVADFGELGDATRLGF